MRAFFDAPVRYATAAGTERVPLTRGSFTPSENERSASPTSRQYQAGGAKRICFLHSHAGAGCEKDIFSAQSQRHDSPRIGRPAPAATILLRRRDSSVSTPSKRAQDAIIPVGQPLREQSGLGIRSHIIIDDTRVIDLGKSVALSGALSSRPGEFHPEPLTEPCVNLSIYTALVIQPRSRKHANGRITPDRPSSPSRAIPGCAAYAATASCTCV